MHRHLIRGKIFAAFLITLTAALPPAQASRQEVPTPTEEKTAKSCEAALKSASWVADLTSLSGRVAFLVSLLDRHPGFINANLSFQRNVLSTLEVVPGLREELGPRAAPNTIAPSPVLSVRYVGERVLYDQKGLKQFIKSRLKDLEDLELLDAADFETQLRHLRGDRDKILRFLRLTPFLYQADGRPRLREPPHGYRAEPQRAAAEAMLTTATVPVLESLFLDFMPLHIAPRVAAVTQVRGYGAIAQLYSSFRNQFVEKEVRPLLMPLNGAAAARTLSLEAVPADVAVVRGCFGKDCSILSVPYYPLIDGVKVHFIRKSVDLTKNPEGYVLSVRVKTSEGQILPYFITVNGPTLSEADIRVAIELVRQSDPEFAATKKVAFPNWETNKILVNWDNSRKAMVTPGGEATLVTPPPGWEILVRYHDETNPENYGNYYGKPGVTTPMVGDFRVGVQFLTPIKRFEPPAPSYLPLTNVDNLSPIERAVIAAQATAHGLDDTKMLEALLGVLKVNATDVDTVEPLLELENFDLSVNDLDRLQKRFGYGLKDLLGLRLDLRDRILTALFRERVELIAELDARRSQVVRDIVVPAFGGDAQEEVLHDLWNDVRISDDQLTLIFDQVRTLRKRRADLIDYVELDLGDRGGLLETYLARIFLGEIKSDGALARELRHCTDEALPAVLDFCSEIIAVADQFPELYDQFPVLEVYNEIASFSADGDFVQATGPWLEDADTTASAKADYLLAHLGGEADHLSSVIASLRPEEGPIFWRRIDERSSFRMYYELAKARGALDQLLENTKAETFQLVSAGMPAIGDPVRFAHRQVDGQTKMVDLTEAFAIAATPETELQWALVMGTELPSIFDVNRPKVNVNYWSVLEYLNRKSRAAGLEPVYEFREEGAEPGYAEGSSSGSPENGDWLFDGTVVTRPAASGYRLPSHMEYEYVVTAWADGVPRLDWSAHNSGKFIHGVAELKANEFGLFDLSGLVSEWNGEAEITPRKMGQLTAGNYKSAAVRDGNPTHMRELSDPSPIAGFRSVKQLQGSEPVPTPTPARP